MAAQPNGEPFIDTIDFGSHHCAMYRWDDTEKWRILADEKRCRRIFPDSATAFRETRRILLARRQIRAERMEAPADVLGIDEWRNRKKLEASSLARSVFGGDGPRHVFTGGGRVVEVVRKRKVRS
jgi:hypothetical protein